MPAKKKHLPVPVSATDDAAELDTRQRDFYQRLRLRMRAWSTSKKGRSHRWAEYLLLAPDIFHLLCKLAMDPRVPFEHRAKLMGAIAYYVSPFDLFAEVMLGPLGFLDDIALAAFVLNGLLKDTPPEVLQSQWAGDGDILDWVKRILGSADDMLGRRLLGRVRKQVKAN
ncbi:MAG: DUF1232 domain-containing protein [Candidatus Hydrogenedens sp.]|nr:DUF1232 domain-containing protein [Candidatus Hydrogenedens sp.]